MTRDEYRTKNRYHASFLTQVAKYLAPEDQKGVVDPELLGANRKAPPLVWRLVYWPVGMAYWLFGRR